MNNKMDAIDAKLAANTKTLEAEMNELTGSKDWLSTEGTALFESGDYTTEDNTESNNNALQSKKEAMQNANATRAQRWSQAQQNQKTWATKHPPQLQPSVHYTAKLSMQTVLNDLDNDQVLDAAHITLDTAVIGAGIGEFSNVIGDEWKGLNGKWYSNDWEVMDLQALEDWLWMQQICFIQQELLCLWLMRL